jgi:pimeloyl-ACP methyl ester carboxylesterase
MRKRRKHDGAYAMPAKTATARRTTTPGAGSCQTPCSTRHVANRGAGRRANLLADTCELGRVHQRLRELVADGWVGAGGLGGTGQRQHNRGHPDTGCAVPRVIRGARDYSRSATPVLIGHSMGGFIVQKYLETGTAPAAVLVSSAPPRTWFLTGLRLARKHPWLAPKSPRRVKR